VAVDLPFLHHGSRDYSDLRASKSKPRSSALAGAARFRILR
jgi:hypothetical protein